MEKYLKSLCQCVLFKNVKEEEIYELLKCVPYTVESYEKNEVIAVEDDDCHSLGIILNGNIEIHKPFPSGKVVTINHFKAGNIFGEALVFSGRHVYPATIISSNQSEIMYIKREEIVKMMTFNPQVIENFMGVLSNRILMLNNRITNLSYDTLRKKISNIILLEYNRQNSPYITLPYSRKKMAELLNIPRPSLSRELVNMKDDGLIDFYKNKIKILDLRKLEDSLL
ncbi:Crp/Fnr family transcriptional regulator [Wansuia hejianensis]|uniref:Crp/Fnr family transcriptional regulator n=1 Tax=Wansuia hejianensis TaxID=2763667 RepID=A0A926F408_9FIRM|nr:Crp/Fnr family transcriptional regulator [Wansuia hejianensis]MBC8591535.1 Crp/Fnr family transcriptional regulator [Wansuia hejianensis]